MGNVRIGSVVASTQFYFNEIEGKRNGRKLNGSFSYGLRREAASGRHLFTRRRLGDIKLPDGGTYVPILTKHNGYNSRFFLRTLRVTTRGIIKLKAHPILL